MACHGMVPQVDACADGRMDGECSSANLRASGVTVSNLGFPTDIVNDHRNPGDGGMTTRSCATVVATGVDAGTGR